MDRPIRYPNLLLRTGVALLSSFYILFHGRTFDLLKLVKTKIFYIAFTVSFVIAVILVYWVHFITKNLDNQFLWTKYPVKRVLLQLLLGVLTPLVLNIGIISAYFHFILDTNIIKSGFLVHDFPIICCFLLIVNLYYMVLFYKSWALGLPPNSSTKRDRQLFIEDSNFSIAKEKEGLILVIKFNGILARFDIANEIVCFWTEERKIYLLTKGGKRYTFCNTTISELDMLLNEIDFYKINRSVIVNSHVMRGYSSTPRRDTFLLILKKEYELILKQEKLEPFYFSRAHLPYFKNKFEKIVP